MVVSCAERTDAVGSELFDVDVVWLSFRHASEVFTVICVVADVFCTMVFGTRSCVSRTDLFRESYAKATDDRRDVDPPHRTHGPLPYHCTARNRPALKECYGRRNYWVGSNAPRARVCVVRVALHHGRVISGKSCAIDFPWTLQLRSLSLMEFALL